MYIVHGFGYLVCYIAFMIVAKLILPDEEIQVDIHELKEKVNVLVILCTDNLLQLHDVGMLEFLEEHYLSICPLGVGRVLECVEVFLEGKDALGAPVDYLPHNPIRPAPYLSHHIEFL